MRAMMFTPHQLQGKQNAAAPAVLTPRDDQKKQVSGILKRVDQLIRQEELDQAKRELMRAKELDPRNVYAMAFEERIENLLVQEHQSRIAAEVTRAAESDTGQRFEEGRSKAEAERKRPTQGTNEHISKAEVQRRTSSPVAPISPFDAAPSPSVLRPAPCAPSAAIQSPEGHKDDLRLYREYLESIWQSGAPTPEEIQQAATMRSMLSIAFSEHEALEREVRMKSYFEAFKRHLAATPSTTPMLPSVHMLRKRFNITEDEHIEVEAKLLNELHGGRKRPTVLIIDDDTRLLELLADVVENAGFEAIALPTSDEAFALLRKLRPDLILCDINLETSTMGGFTFYEKIQEREHLRDVPFIFLTGLTDEVLVRTGKELGVDDYLTKPISDATLVATIRGKLKRYRQLRTVCAKADPTAV